MRACKLMRTSHDGFYRAKNFTRQVAKKPFEINRRKPILKSKVAPEVEEPLCG